MKARKVPAGVLDGFSPKPPGNIVLAREGSLKPVCFGGTLCLCGRDEAKESSMRDVNDTLLMTYPMVTAGEVCWAVLEGRLCKEHVRCSCQQPFSSIVNSDHSRPSSIFYPLYSRTCAAPSGIQVARASEVFCGVVVMVFAALDYVHGVVQVVVKIQDILQSAQERLRDGLQSQATDLHGVGLVSPVLRGPINLKL